jgi:hypothetical protein
MREIMGNVIHAHPRDWVVVQGVVHLDSIAFSISEALYQN